MGRGTSILDLTELPNTPNKARKIKGPCSLEAETTNAENTKEGTELLGLN